MFYLILFNTKKNMYTLHYTYLHLHITQKTHFKTFKYLDVAVCRRQVGYISSGLVVT